MQCPVIRVVHPHEPEKYPFLEINASDFDPAIHKRVVVEAPPVLAPPPAPPPAPPNPLDSLPADWADKSATDDLKRIAAAVNDGRAVENRKQATEVIKQALAARP